jgi:hypothetical protein
MKKINLNRNIYFELTPKGKERLKDSYFAACVHPAETGLYYTQMWVFCGLFGQDMRYPGMTKDVTTNVYFNEEDVT